MNAPAMGHDPSQLAARAARGDERAFAQLVEATIARVHRLCARMLGDAAEAEDVTQEVYVKAHDALLRGDFDGRAKVETWLHRIAVNTALNALRARRPRGGRHRDRRRA
jgi:RNA polymerase sigma-70 factor (ECF subfamily)